MDLQHLNPSTEFHTEMLLFLPHGLHLFQTVTKLPVLMNNVIHVQDLSLEHLHILALFTLSSHLGERVSSMLHHVESALPTSFSIIYMRQSSWLPMEEECRISKLVGTSLLLVDIPSSNFSRTSCTPMVINWSNTLSLLEYRTLLSPWR